MMSKAIKKMTVRPRPRPTSKRRLAKILPRRIVILDDQPEMGECWEMMLREYLLKNTKPLEIVTFTDSVKAMDELLRENPDLFITDWNHTGIRCDEMFEFLARKKIKYPIFVITASADLFLKKHLLEVSRKLGLTIRIQGKPCMPDDLRRLMSRYFYFSAKVKEAAVV